MKERKLKPLPNPDQHAEWHITTEKSHGFPGLVEASSKKKKNADLVVDGTLKDVVVKAKEFIEQENLAPILGIQVENSENLYMIE